MTPAARYQAAIEVLDAMQSGGLRADAALAQWGRAHRFAGSGDRAAIGSHVYQVLRNQGRVRALGHGDTGRAMILGLLHLQGIAPEDIFTGQTHAPAALSADEAQAPVAAVDIGLDTPDWMHPLLARRFGAALPDLLALMSDRAPIYLRVNLARISRAKAQAELAAEGIATAPCVQSDSALIVTGEGRKIAQSRAYQAGLVELQDLSVQMALAALPDLRGKRVLDYCAGAGGKALAMAAQGADVTAHDADPRRMADLRPRATRAQAHIAQASARALPALAPFDLVLCDVPCSGSGTWRRDPQVRWTLDPETLASLCQTQAEILDAACALAGAAGQIAYMTCSLFDCENDDQIVDFLRRHPRYRLIHQQSFDPIAASDGFFLALLSPEGS